MDKVEKKEVYFGKLTGSSPSENKFYLLIMFDISDIKKYRLLMKILKKYAFRVQKSVFEAYLKERQITSFTQAVERLMFSNKYYDPADNIRIYRISGNCKATIYGSYKDMLPEENIFI